MKNTIRIMAAMALIVGTGLVHGAWTHRWGAPAALAAIAGRLNTLPKVLGDWKGVDRELSPLEQAATGAVGYLSRVYTNGSKGLAVSVLLLTGLPGNISTHTPDVCYPGAGFTLGETELYPRQYGDGEQVAQFRTSRATRGGPNPAALRIYWAWHGSTGWSAPEDPRWAFAHEPMLTKLYVVRETGGGQADPKSDPCNELLTLILPELDRLISRPGQSSEAAPSASRQ